MPTLLRNALLMLVALALSARIIAYAEPAARPEFVVIVHPDNPVRSLTRRTLGQMYLKEVSRWEHGESVRPVDLPRESSTRSKFSNEVIGRSVGAVRSYWQQRIFSGRGVPPPELENEAEVVSFVLKQRGAVGYIAAGSDPGKAKVLSISGD